MPEIRLGSGENLTNMQLGEVQVDEVRLGSILVWRNNVPPFLRLLVNGTQIDDNGTPMTPTDQMNAANAVLTVFTYNDAITIRAEGVQDEDMMYPVTISIYEGDFESDSSLTAIATGSVASANGAVNLTIPRGPIPSGPNAADFIYANRLFTLAAEDAEEGISYFFFRLTRTDVVDQWNSSAFANTGAQFNQRSSPIVQSGLTSTTGTACTDQTRTTITFTRTTPRQVASQNQVRTNTYQVNGIQDGPGNVTNPTAPTEPSRTRVTTVTVSTGSPSDVVTNTVTSPNPAFVSGPNVVTMTVAGPTSTTTGTCTVQGMTPNNFCRCTAQTCNGQQSVTSQPTVQDQNCAGGNVGAPRNSGSPTTSNRSCSGATNPSYQAPSASISRCRVGGSNNDIASIGAMIQNRNTANITASGTCQDGSAFSVSRQVSCPGNPVDRVNCTGGPCTGVAAASTRCSPSNPIATISCVLS